MSSISMYKELKDKHSKQETFLQEAVTEKLTNVDIDTLHEFDVNKKKVRVDGQPKAVSAKSLFVSVYSKEYVDRLSEADVNQITDKKNLKKIARLSVSTQDTKENQATIRDYSLDNTERNEKTRNKHREKVHKHANELILCAGVHRDAIEKCDELVAKEELSPAEKKTLKKEFMKKYKLDLEVIEQEYQMNKNLLLMGGKKDISEEDSLFRLKYTRYAKAIAANRKGIEMAEKYPDLFDAATFQEKIEKINKKLNALGDKVSPALMESKKNYFVRSFHRRNARLTAKRNEELHKRELAEMKEKQGELMQRSIDNYIAKKTETGTAEEVAWIKENLIVDELATALAQGKGSNILLTGEFKKASVKGFFENTDQAMELFIDRFLFDKATKISQEDITDLKKRGIPAEGIDRSVRTQLHPVRKLKDGRYASDLDRQNDLFNQKYMNSLRNNEMEARRECIEENFGLFYNFNFDIDNLEQNDYYKTNSWHKFMIQRMFTGASNLKTDRFSAGSSIMDNREIATELHNRFLQEKGGDINVNGKSWNYGDFLLKIFALYSQLTHAKFNVDPGNGQLCGDVTDGSPAVKDFYIGELKAYIDAFRAAQNNAGAQQ